MVLALVVVGLTLSREAVGLVVVARRSILFVNICWALGGLSTAVFFNVTLSTGAAASCAIHLELTGAGAALAFGALGPVPWTTGSSIAAGIVAFLQK